MTAADRTLTKPIHTRFEDLSASYRLECTRGIPMSVHERYQRRQSLLREELRRQKTSCPLGEVLKRIGVVDEEQIANALSIQKASGEKKLLGEILIDLESVDEQTIRRAVEAQVRTAEPNAVLERGT